MSYTGEIIPRNKLVRKILSVLPSSWESKVNAITEVKDLQKLTIDELLGNLRTYKMKKKKDNERREPKREKNRVLKTDNNDSSGEDGDTTYLIRRFQKMVRRNGGIPKRGSSSKPKNYDLCHKCGNPGHFIKDCPLLKQDQFKHNTDKAAKRNPIPDKLFKRKNVADNVVKQALATWGDSFSESEEENDHGDSSMMVVESEANEYDLIIALMDQCFNKELGEAEQTRDDLVVVVVDLKETIENLKKEKDALDEKIANIEHKRDDLMVIVVDLKETTECVRKEKEFLTERVANIEHEGDDLLVVLMDLKEIIGELKIESRPENSQKGKEVARNSERKQPTIALQGGSASFGNGKKGHILGVGKIGKSLSHSIKNVSYMNGLKYSLLSVSQICDKGNKVEFVSNICTATNLVTGEVVLVAKRYKNIYVADFESLQNGDLSCLSVVDDDAELWHRRTKDETIEVFVAFVKKIQVKMGNNVACIRSDRGTEFDNAKFDEFCTENVGLQIISGQKLSILLATC
ncbi:uncharacterized protein LOC142167902 [Nicotiana tabacum]|uniref:Uncharacterized protein LOC142167902 n=1 Tax=Nicotiana tabacum TaxID=4097 RepID=A0AC58SHM4_TOBAC